MTVVVIGGGHAGLEATMAASALVDNVILITQNLDAIARMSCNPAIGGLAKGNIVKEIDALGGLMGLLADSALLQFRMLNQSRGAAVRAPRGQEDKYKYSCNAKKLLESRPNITLIEGTVVDILEKDSKVSAVVYLENDRHTITKAEAVEQRIDINDLIVTKVSKRKKTIPCDAVVLTTGTFMNAKTFVGSEVKIEGRIGEEASLGLSENLRAKKFSISRLKTGTPARVYKNSLDYSKLQVQHGDAKIVPFSFSSPVITDKKKIESQDNCYITFTNERTHQIIRDNLSRSPLFSGLIVGIGPRYCPSIEDKVKRFPDRDRHQIFVEPEGKSVDTLYLNGLSSSLPRDVQDSFLHTIEGLENVEIQRYAYAVEYDFLDPRDLYPTLESKIIKNLFIAGQTNGTSGYEEAAGQGLIAGINASLKLNGREGLVLGRDEAYIGVLIDDLTTKGTNEPYRMFTSRAEYRIGLRADSADRRLSPYGISVGLLKEERKDKFLEKLRKIDEFLDEIKRLRKESKIKLEDEIKKDGCTADELISAHPELLNFDYLVVDTVVNDIKYKGYQDRERSANSMFKKAENIKISKDFNYDELVSLSKESREKLKKIQPLTLAQAQRISGIRQSDLALLYLYLSGKLKGNH